MAAELPQRVLRMKLACKDNIEFLLMFAPKLKAGVFVPLEDAPPVGAQVALHIRFTDGQVHVKGTAEVLKAVTEPRPGIHARFVSLDPDSVQFPLRGRKPAAAPSEEPGESNSGETSVLPFTVSGEYRMPPASEVALPGGSGASPAEVTLPGAVAPQSASSRASSGEVTLPGAVAPTRPSAPSAAPPRSSPSTVTSTPRASAPSPAAPPSARASLSAFGTTPGTSGAPSPSAPPPRSSPSASFSAPLPDAPAPRPSLPPLAIAPEAPVADKSPAPSSPRRIASAFDAGKPSAFDAGPPPPPDEVTQVKPAAAPPPSIPSAFDAGKPPAPAAVTRVEPAAAARTRVPSADPFSSTDSGAGFDISDDVTAAPPTRAPAPRAQDDDADAPAPRRSRLPLAAAAVLLAGLLAAGAWFALRPAAKPAGAVDPALLALLEKVDARMASKQYAAPGGDAALDHLRIAVKAAPQEPAVVKRQRALADVFETRARAAEGDKDYAEAAVHLQALVLTTPASPEAQARLAHAEDVVRNQTRGKP